MIQNKNNNPTAPDSSGTKKKFTGLLGIARKASMITLGTEQTADAIRFGSNQKKVLLVLVAGDVSANTAKRIGNCAAFYNVKLMKVPLSSAELAKATGKYAEVACVGVTDKGFAGSFEKYLAEIGTEA